MSVRQPAVAGMFYESNPAALREEVVACFAGPSGPGSIPRVNLEGARRIVGLVSPHAGFMYSGATAAHGYSRLAEDGLPDIVVLIGPSHRPVSAPAAIADDDAWHTPLGDVPVDRPTAERIAAAFPSLTLDSWAHRLEHSIEVQLPFVQLLTAQAGVSLRIVPILIGTTVVDFEVSQVVQGLGQAIASALEGENAVVIASTDFTHYESQQTAERQDSEAIRRILDLDADGLISTVKQFGISMCGVVPTAACIVACKDLGATSARTLNYRTSGDVTGDYSQVVGYASIELDR